MPVVLGVLEVVVVDVALVAGVMGTVLGVVDVVVVVDVAVVHGCVSAKRHIASQSTRFIGPLQGQ